MQLENVKKENKENIAEDSHVLHFWQPCKFEINDEFTFVNDNFIFNTFSNLLYMIAYPLLLIINKFFFGFKIEGKENLENIDSGKVTISNHVHPMVINRAFNKLIKENGLPHVVFHSLRHSSITYKLKLNGGDMKSVQGDSGHAQVKMVADVYSHIIDEDRCINAQRLEEAFYSSKTPDPVEDTEPKTADTAVTESDESDAAKILELLKNPETAALLKQLAKAL